MTNEEQRINRRRRFAKRPMSGARATGRTRKRASACEVEVRRAGEHVFLGTSDSRASA